MAIRAYKLYVIHMESGGGNTYGVSTIVSTSKVDIPMNLIVNFLGGEDLYLYTLDGVKYVRGIEGLENEPEEIIRIE